MEFSIDNSDTIMSVLEKDEAELWLNYIDRKDIVSKEALISFYMPFVKMVAKNIYFKHNLFEISLDDLVQLGVVGLLETIDRYDPNRNAAFKTYATYRVRGSILNGIKSYSENLDFSAYKRNVRQERLKSIEKHQSEGGEKDLFDDVLDFTLGLAVGYLLEGDDEIYERVDQNPYANPDQFLIRKQLRKIVEILPDKMQRIIEYHYFHGFLFAEIAEILNVSKARVSQLHAEGIAIIRKSYEKQLNQSV